MVAKSLELLSYRRKAQHLYLEQVMANPQHPRFAIYQRIIADCSQGQDRIQRKTAVRGANRFTVVEMTQVTADLYDIYLILFNMDEEGKKLAANRLPFITRGSRNCPHKFMRWIARLHYEPMRPDVPRPSEYHFPNVTYESTRHLPSSPARPNRTGVRHSWRYDYGNEVSEQLYPRPIIPLPSEANIAFAIGAKPQGQRRRFSTKPGYLPPRKSSTPTKKPKPAKTFGLNSDEDDGPKAPKPRGHGAPLKPTKTAEVISLESDKDDGPEAPKPRRHGASPKPTEMPEVISLDGDEDDGPEAPKPRGRGTPPSLTQEKPKRPNRPGLRERPTPTSKANPKGTHSLIREPKLMKTPEVIEPNTDEDNNDEDNNDEDDNPAAPMQAKEEGKRPLKRPRKG